MEMPRAQLVMGYFRGDAFDACCERHAAALIGALFGGGVAIADWGGPRAVTLPRGQMDQLMIGVNTEPY
jgi:hypothetical protein